MSAFSISPLTNVPPPQADEFPNFIQWQEDGVNLGGPDADTINCSSGITATRGVGENSNVVTLTAAGGATIGVSRMIAPADPPSEDRMLFDGTSFLDQWTDVALVVSADWEWQSIEQLLHIITAGVYRVTLVCSLDTDNYGAEWPDGNSTYGSTVIGAFTTNTSAQARTHTTGDLEDQRNVMAWTDQHIIEASADSTYQVGVYAKASDTSVPVRPGMVMIVERLGDLPS